jgi:hypothetical protein
MLFLAALRIDKGLKDIDTFEEEEVTMEVVLSKPDARGKWFKDGKIIYPDQRYTNKFQVFNFFFFFRTVILNEGKTHTLKLKYINLKDAGDISFQCGDVKDSCKISVKECMYRCSLI